MSGNDKMLIGSRLYQLSNDTTKETKTETRKERKKMNIITADNKTINDRVLTYKMTRSPETMKLSGCADQRLEVQHYCIYEDEKPDRNGEVKTSTIITMMTVQGEIYGSNSATVREKFLNLIDIFGDDLNDDNGYIPVKIIQGVSKNNRTFYTCTYAD